MKSIRKRFSDLLPVIGCVVSLLYSGLVISDTVVRSPTGDRFIDDSYFGMHVRWGATTYYWPEARFRSWRIITSETTWYALEKEKGLWRFDALDRAVARAETQSVEVLYTLGYPPKRAVAARYQEVWNPGIALPPQDLQEWEDYVRRIVERYKGRIKYYELMNEPHFSEVDKPHSKVDFPAATMVEMARIASRVIKKTDPEAKLISMSPSGLSTGVRRVDAFLKAGGGKYIDAVGFHFYTGRHGPEKIPELVSELRTTLANNGLPHISIWNTEAGFFIDSPDKPRGTWVVPEHETLYSAQQGSAMVSRALILGAATGLSRYYWYSWDIPTMALTEGKGIAIAPAGHAYIRTERWLRGSTISECRTADKKLWICNLSRGERRARLVWNTSGEREWMVPTEWQAKKSITLLGIETDFSFAPSIRLNEAPVLILSDHQAWGTP